MARAKDQTARREQLIVATLRTIAHHGLAGTTMKGIADDAGFSPRLIPYYYADLEALIEAAHEAATERYFWTRHQTISENLPPPRKLARLMHSGLPQKNDLLLSQVLNEISVNAGRSPLHSSLVTLLFDREVSLYVDVLEAGRTTCDFILLDRTETIARNFVILEDALGLHLLGNNTSLTLETAYEQLSSFAGAVTGRRVAPAAATPFANDL